MISSVPLETSEGTVLLKFSTRAQARVERNLDASIALVMMGMQSRFGVHGVCEILAASWDDGAGCPVDSVYDVVDAIGHVKANEVVGELINKAFPEVDADSDKKPDAKKK